MRRDEFVPAREVGSAHGADGAGQGGQEVEAAGDLPAVEVARGGGAPDVDAQLAARAGDDLGHLGDKVGVHPRLAGGVLEGELGVLFLHPGDEILECGLIVRMERRHVLAPVEPLLDELGVELAGVEQVLGDGQENGRLGAAVGGQPVVGLGGGVREAGVNDDEFRARRMGLDDSLGRGVVVVARVEVAADEKDGLGVREIRGGPVAAVPEGLADAGRGAAHVGVAVVPVHPPGGEGVEHEAVLAGPSDVVDDLVAALFLDGLADSPGDVVERIIPAHALPFALAALSGALHRVEDAIRVVDLVHRHPALGAVTPARGGVEGVTLDFSDFQIVLVHIGQQPAARLAVKTKGGHQHVVALDLLGPIGALVLVPIVPLVRARVGDERAA